MVETVLVEVSAEDICFIANKHGVPTEVGDAIEFLDGNVNGFRIDLDGNTGYNVHVPFYSGRAYYYVRDGHLCFERHDGKLYQVMLKEAAPVPNTFVFPRIHNDQLDTITLIPVSKEYVLAEAATKCLTGKNEIIAKFLDGPYQGLRLTSDSSAMFFNGAPGYYSRARGGASELVKPDNVCFEWHDGKIYLVVWNHDVQAAAQAVFEFARARNSQKYESFWQQYMASKPPLQIIESVFHEPSPVPRPIKKGEALWHETLAQQERRKLDAVVALRNDIRKICGQGSNQ